VNDMRATSARERWRLGWTIMVDPAVLTASQSLEDISSRTNIAPLGSPLLTI
jgi:hypothetical protein